MPLEKPDVIIVLCSHDIQAADRGAQLFHKGCAILIFMSGRLALLTARMCARREAELFAARAIDLSVLSDKIWTKNPSPIRGKMWRSGAGSLLKEAK